MKTISVLLIVLTFSISANAEIYEEIGYCVKTREICVVYWPKLPHIDGWHQDITLSKQFVQNFQIPDNSTSKTPKTFISVQAIYKPKKPNIKSINELVVWQKTKFKLLSPSLVIIDAEPISTADGQSLKSFTAFPIRGETHLVHKWTRISFGEEGEYFLIFLISSRTNHDYQKSLGVYKKFINNYKEKMVPEKKHIPKSKPWWKFW